MSPANSSHHLNFLISSGATDSPHTESTSQNSCTWSAGLLYEMENGAWAQTNALSSWKEQERSKYSCGLAALYGLPPSSAEAAAQTSRSGIFSPAAATATVSMYQVGEEAEFSTFK